MKNELASTQEPKNISGFNLQWCVGMNAEQINGVKNISLNNKNELCYSSGHMLILYDYSTMKQRIMQGHSNNITATIYNEQEKILVSVDEGENSLMIVWHYESGCPVRTIFDPEPMGICNLDISNDGNRILTLSVPYRGV